MNTSPDNLYIKTKDFSVSKEDFSLFYNEEYDYLQTFPQPENIAKYYESEDYISHTDRNKGLFEKIYQLVKRYMLSRKVQLLEKYIKNKGTLLDIGAGTGDFLRIAQKKGWQVTGVEPNQKAIDNARKKNISLYKNLEEVQRTFDCITLWHVLEHIPNLQLQIDFINKHLQTNGILIIAVPNYKSKDAFIYQEFWAGYDVPRHLWHFSKTSISKLFSDNHFQIINIKPMLFDAFYISLLSEKYKTGKINFIKGFVNGFRSNLSAIQTGEYSSLIYILKKIK
ncbi:class I SAM-dependent methyltransferase [Capnocytophaga catalasegens]|uniref:Methyltransferase n=1 Tax=Capnocytophaga catalasegens TaxID=1004260 RepID=A0AAV5AW03_9FLAO|nr:class I SAM-dependent methyltransferase [Capnocytophaga catalasegens]GIZ15089.1 methyltransferase [Capnocytophaga catalasegens]GJM50026.1 methyltransferase [Capnocytophaga catalasegens]GJM53897.1 methyltransferase [Capnocytophaga catalasegens]